MDGGGDNAGNQPWHPDVPVPARGREGVSQEAVLPCVFPREPQTFAKSISHSRGTPMSHEPLFNSL